MYYFVSGIILLTDECGCPHCKGDHTHAIVVQKRLLRAASPEAAAADVLGFEEKTFSSYPVTECEWTEGPVVVEAPADEVMRRLGQKSLFEGVVYGQ